MPTHEKICRISQSSCALPNLSSLRQILLFFSFQKPHLTRMNRIEKDSFFKKKYSCSYHGTAKPTFTDDTSIQAEKPPKVKIKVTGYMTFNMFYDYHAIVMWLFKWTSDFSTDRITTTARCCNSIISMFQRLLTPDPGEQRLIPRSPRCTASLAVRLNPKLTWHVSQNRGLIPEFTGVLKISAPREQNRKLASESVRV